MPYRFLAKAAKLHLSTVWRLLNGHTANPTLATLLAISDALECDLRPKEQTDAAAR